MIAAATLPECWRALERGARDLGYTRLTARIGESWFQTAADIEQTENYWQMRLNLSAECWVNISQEEGGAEQPLLLIPFVEIIRRILPEKVAQLHAASEGAQPRPRNSKTTTVISSDCAVPSVNPATAS